MFFHKKLSIQIFILSCLVPGMQGYFLKEIRTGEVGVRYVRGQLQKTILLPDWHFYFPGYSSVVPIKVQQDVDEFGDIACGSSDGNKLIFQEVRVTNEPSHDPDDILDMVSRFTTNYEKLLIENIIKKVIYETCATMTQDEIYRTKFEGIDERIKNSLTSYQERFNTHLTIIDVALEKPHINSKFQQLYDTKTEEESKIVNQRTIQERVLQQKLTQKMSEEQDARREQLVSEINNEKLKMEAESARTIQGINDAKDAESRKIAADSQAYERKTQAHANKELLTTEFLEYQHILHVVAKADAFYGPELPRFVMQSRGKSKEFTTAQIVDEEV